MVPLTTWVPTVPNRPIAPVPSPGLIKVRLLGIRNLVESRTVGIDDTNGRLPVPYLRSIHIAAKEHQFVTGLRPRWLEIPMPLG